MLFNVQRSQEFIFCLAENHFHDESSLGLSMDLACHLELSELRTSNHATNVGGCVTSLVKHATAATTARALSTKGAENSVPGVRPMENTCLNQSTFYCSYRNKI